MTTSNPRRRRSLRSHSSPDTAIAAILAAMRSEMESPVRIYGLAPRHDGVLSHATRYMRGRLGRAIASHEITRLHMLADFRHILLSGRQMIGGRLPSSEAVLCDGDSGSVDLDDFSGVEIESMNWAVDQFGRLSAHGGDFLARDDNCFGYCWMAARDRGDDCVDLLELVREWDRRHGEDHASVLSMISLT